MPTPGTYATVEEVEESRKRFPQSRWTFDAKTQDLLRRIQNAPSQQALARKPAAPKSFLMNALEMPSRPLQATASAIGYGLSGRDPLQGAWQGLQGQSGITGMADVLEQQGVPELGRFQLGPLDIKGRDVAGFGLDIAADPLTFLGGKAVGLIGKGGEAAAKGAGGLGALSGLVEPPALQSLSKLVAAGKREAGELGEMATRLPRRAAELVNKKRWYHGTNTEKLTAQAVDPTYYGSVDSLFGFGFYLTDAPDIAKGYAAGRSKRQGVPSTYEVKTAVQKVLDLDEPVPSDVVDALRGAVHPDYLDTLEKAAAKPKATGADVFDGFRESLADMAQDLQISRAEIVENFQDAATNLLDLGYDALTHTGGLRTGKPAHQVLILLDPNLAGKPSRIASLRSEISRPLAEMESDLARQTTEWRKRAGPQTISERMATDFAPKGVGKLVQAATKLPGVEGIGRLIDRRPFAKLPAEQMSILHADKMARVENIATREAARFRVPGLFQIGEHGGAIVDGVEYGARDLAEKLGDSAFVAKMTPEQVDWVKKASDFIEPLHAKVREANGGRFALREIEEGGQYFPSRVIKQAREFGEYEKVPVGGAKTFEHKIQYRTQKEGMEAGKTYADPFTTLYLDIKDSLRAIYDGELRTALKGIGKEVDVSGLAKLQGQLKTAMLAEKNVAKHAALKKQYDEVTKQMEGVGEKLAPWEMESAVAREFAESGGRNFVNPFPGFDNETVLKVANKHGLNPYESSDWADGVLRDKGFWSDLRFERKASGLTPDKIRMAAEEAATRGDVTEQYRQLGKLKSQLGGRMATAEGRVLKQVETAGAESAADVRPLIALEAKRIADEKATLKELGLVHVKGQPFAKNIFVEPSDAKVIEEYIGKKAGPGWKKASDVVGVMRTMSSNLDMGAGFLQGLPLLARNPIAWGRTQAYAFKQLIDTTTRLKYHQNEKFQLVHGFFEGQLATSMPEVTGAVTSGQIGGLAEKTVGKLPIVGKPIAKGFTNLMERAAGAFDMLGDAARTEMGYAMMGVAEKSGKKREIAEFINHLSGVSEPAAWGISPNQRAIESTVLFFSPRYTRAALAVIGDLTRMDVIGVEAWKTMASMLIGGVATYYKLANMMDQEPNLDPSSSRFLSLQAGSEQVNVGSVWMSAARLLGKSITNPGTLFNADPQNPLIAWWRGRSAPVGQVISDLVTQENYFGEPIGGPVGLAKETAKKGLPFALQSFLETPGPQPGTIPAQLLGLNVNPQNYFERREGIAGEVGKAPYAELTPFQQQEVSQRTRALNLPIRGDEQQQQAAVFDAHQKNMKTIADRVARGVINKKQYKEQRQDAYTQLAVRLQDLKEKFPKTAEEEQKRWDRMSLREQARDKWLTILATKDEAGEPQYEEADAFLSGLPKEIQDYVDDVGTAAIGNLPQEAQALERELRNARRTLRPYWQIAEDVMKQRGLYDDYQAMNPAEQAKYERTAKYKLAEKIWERRRKAYKRGKPDVQRALEDWYGYAPKRRLAPLNPSGIAA